ncbi:heparinase II/III domain-containing protein [Propionibacteriaceae bacterium Y2011]
MPDDHLRTVYRAGDLARARENLRRHDWAKTLVDRLRADVADTVAGGAERIAEFISTTTPAAPHFTNCPRCLGNAIHGHYHWSAADPDVLECSTCGARYPDPAYPEDVVFHAADGQQVSYHGGYGHPFNGFSLHSSWSGNIRSRKVAYMTEQLRVLAVLYAVTGEVAYGDTAAAVLARFAEVYPGYLVHSGYGEWTDLPPREAATRLESLPQDEWTIAPNVADRKLHAGYWMAGRATASGGEGHFVQQLAIAYDLVRERIDPATRTMIENDLLRESVPLLCADPRLNNKSITNAIGAGMVGLVLDDPGLIRFGSRVFWHFVRRWFLPDGGTPESPSYGLMALHSMITFGDALHGRRLCPDGPVTDVYGDPGVARIYRNIHDTFLPDLSHPGFADSYVGGGLRLRHADLLVSRYDRPEYRALLRRTAGLPVDQADEVYALFHRSPDLDVAQGEDRSRLPDVLLPSLRLPYLRAGVDGLDATVIVSASHWGVHHHYDSLNLTYWDRGHEVVTDLGYLWDRTDHHQTKRTAAHNVVVVDGGEQRDEGRGGSVDLFDRRGPIAVVECSSTPYAQADLYRRTCVLIDHGGPDRYLVDVFAVVGGREHDHLLHGPVPDVVLADVELVLDPEGPGHGLTGSRRAERVDHTWRARFELDDETTFSAWAPAADEQLWLGDGWGERGLSHVSEEPGRTVPYFVRRRSADRVGRAADAGVPGVPGGRLSSVFVSVFEVHGSSPTATPVVRGVRSERIGADGVVVQVDTRSGVDVVALRPRYRPPGSSAAGGPATELRAGTDAGALRTDAAITVLGNGVLYLADGTRAELGDHRVELAAARSGGLARASVTGVDGSHLVVDRADLRVLPQLPATVIVDDGVDPMCFPVLDVHVAGDRVRLVTARGEEGSPLPTGAGLTWTMLHSGADRP